MDLGDLFEVIINYLLIREKTCLSHRDGVTIVSVLVCIITYWTKLMVSHDIGYRVVMISPSYYVV